MPLAVAVIIAVCARWGRLGIWTAWAALYLPLAAFTWPMSQPGRLSPSDDWLFTKIILAGGIMTAAAAWVVDRRTQQEPSTVTWHLAGLAIVTVIVTAIISSIVFVVI
jgi:hypothetical protein